MCDAHGQPPYGVFEEGQLWLHDEDGATVLMAGEVVGAMDCVSRSRLRGRLTDLRRQWTAIQESQLHAVAPISEVRYSFVCYSRMPAAEVTPHIAEELATM